mmetsp:Transcript_18894/g.37938  ORF Transcript_18894/g.37938 Transcript_18894/m.37938 type:complete len:87 (+) Transcript_18894:284-544(+)
MAGDDQPPSTGRLFSLGELETVSAAAVMGLVTAKAAHSHCPIAGSCGGEEVVGHEVAVEFSSVVGGGVRAYGVREDGGAGEEGDEG